MRFILSMALAAISTTSAANAQTSQQGVIGASDNPSYPVLVRGSDGTVFACKDEITEQDGASVRQCIREDDETGAFLPAGDGLGVAAGVGAAVVGIALIASDSSNDSSTTTTGAASR